MFKIAKWYNNYQAPVVLMIDDLSDAYIKVYNEKHKNDWGYLCDSEESVYVFLKKNLLNKYPEIRITFFVPYAKHNVINEYSEFSYEKYAVGDRLEFTHFLKKISDEGHEIAHHGSNHGKYIDNTKVTTVDNWTHEWALFKSVEEGVKVTLKGADVFKEKCSIDILGGKYCGYITNEYSQKIIDKCNFLYWCDKPSYTVDMYDEDKFGSNNIISFPTNFAGNSYVRLTYVSGYKKKDDKKKILKFFQPIYSIYSSYKLLKLYKSSQIISIQEHYSPATTAGTVQSANIVTDIQSLNKIFSFLSRKSIWYATCKEIAKYIYVRDNTTLHIKDNNIILYFDNYKNIASSFISILDDKNFTLQDSNNTYKSHYANGYFVVNLELKDGTNKFRVI